MNSYEFAWLVGCLLATLQSVNILLLAELPALFSGKTNKLPLQSQFHLYHCNCMSPPSQSQKHLHDTGPLLKSDLRSQVFQLYNLMILHSFAQLLQVWGPKDMPCHGIECCSAATREFIGLALPYL